VRMRPATQVRKRHLTLSAEADGVLSRYALHKGSDMGSIVTRLILTYVPRYELVRTEALKNNSDIETDRQNEAAA
jgi:hypothetical protein